MTNLPISNSLSGDPGPPFYGVNPAPVSVGTVTIDSSAIEGPSGTKTIGPLQIALAVIGTDEVLELVFPAAGSEIITAPPNATLMVIRPPAANTVGLTLDGAAVSPSNPCLISFPNTAGGATYTLGAAAAVTGAVAVTFA